MWLVELDHRVPAGPAVIAETLAVGIACGLSLSDSTGAVGALAVGPFVAGLRRGRPGAGAALVSGFVAALATTVAAAGLPDRGRRPRAGQQRVAGVGFGLIASFLHTTLRRDPDPLAPYHDARDLVRELIAVSDGLTSSLDPTVLGGGAAGPGARRAAGRGARALRPERPRADAAGHRRRPTRRPTCATSRSWPCAAGSSSGP